MPSVVHHYVPQWYQERFFEPGQREQKFFYLDKHPDTVTAPNGKTYTRNDVLRWGTPRCFQEEHLYSARFGKAVSDLIERQFFGRIDDVGSNALPLIAEYRLENDLNEAWQGFMHFMGAQKQRTPKTLDLIALILASRGIKPTQNNVMRAMRDSWQVFHTAWTEAVWEIVHASQSDIKFIVSDDPVTVYNYKAFPNNSKWKYPFDPPVGLVASQTLYPLDREHCLILTNLDYARNPDRDPLKMRLNYRVFEQTMFKMMDVQTRRELSRVEVATINYILKTRARRYIAAAKREWLYPETLLSTLHWSKLGGFLLPNPNLMGFGTAIIVGYEDKRKNFAIDEYGYHPSEANKLRDRRRANDFVALEKRRDPNGPAVMHAQDLWLPNGGLSRKRKASSKKDP